MTKPVPRRRGWCPGALAPMEVGDGLLVRVRVPAGVLPSPAARRIATLAAEHGNGLLELSHRGNLQIRGVSRETLNAVTGALAELGFLAADPVSEAVRNVLTAPTAGLDPDAVLDVRPYALALDARLATDAALHRLPPKFGFVVCGGGGAPLAHSNTDIRFDAVATPDGPRFRVAVGGTRASATPLGLCRPDELVEVAAALATAFLELRESLSESPRRMATLIKAIGTDAFPNPLPPRERVVPEAPLAGTEFPLTASGGSEIRREPGEGAPRILGLHPGWLGAAFPFGGLSAGTLSALADLAPELRITPWRALLLAGADESALEPVLALGGILDDADLRLKVTACSGAPGCDVGTTDTRADALALTRVAPALVAACGMVHVSGCEKLCAHPSPTAVTLVARDGLYDVQAAGIRIRGGLPTDAAIACVAALEGVYLAHRRPGEGAAAVFARLGAERLIEEPSLA